MPNDSLPAKSKYFSGKLYQRMNDDLHLARHEPADRAWLFAIRPPTRRLLPEDAEGSDRRYASAAILFEPEGVLREHAPPLADRAPGQRVSAMTDFTSGQVESSPEGRSISVRAVASKSRDQQLRPWLTELFIGNESLFGSRTALHPTCRHSLLLLRPSS